MQKNLYRWAMSQELPVDSFEWFEVEDILSINEKLN